MPMDFMGRVLPWDGLRCGMVPEQDMSRESTLLAKPGTALRQHEVLLIYRFCTVCDTKYERCVSDC